jgi:hypothetical protein
MVAGIFRHFLFSVTPNFCGAMEKKIESLKITYQEKKKYLK